MKTLMDLYEMVANWHSSYDFAVLCHETGYNRTTEEMYQVAEKLLYNADKVDERITHKEINMIINHVPLDNITINGKPLYVPANVYLDFMAREIMRCDGCNYTTAVVAIVKKTLEYGADLEHWSDAYFTNDPIAIANSVWEGYNSWCMPSRRDVKELCK